MERRLSLLDQYHVLKDGGTVEYEHPFTGELQEAHGVSDFPTIIGNQAGKQLLNVFRALPQVWREYVRVARTAKLGVAEPDVILGQFGDLVQSESDLAETQEGSISEFSPTRTVNEFKRSFVVSRSVVVNDDVQALNEMATQFARAAYRTLVKKVVAKIELNTVAYDAVKLFADTRDNYRTGNQPAWYVLADPNLSPAITVSFLNGVEEPALLLKRAEMISLVGGGEDPYGYAFDDMTYKVRYDFGTDITEPTAILKSNETLTAANLKAAINQLEGLTSPEGELTGNMASILLVSRANRWAAKELVASAEKRDTTASTEFGTSNPLEGALHVVYEPLLTNTYVALP